MTVTFLSLTDIADPRILVALSMAVVCTVAISCWPNVLRTMSSPLARGGSCAPPPLALD
jgi:hypothetical protein